MFDTHYNLLIQTSHTEPQGLLYHDTAPYGANILHLSVMRLFVVCHGISYDEQIQNLKKTNQYDIIRFYAIDIRNKMIRYNTILYDNGSIRKSANTFMK